MPDEATATAVETQEVPLDQVTDMREYKKARTEGKETVTQAKPVATEVIETNEGEETAKDGEKPKSKGGFQKRIDRLVKQTATLEEQLAAARKELEGKSGKAEETPKPADGEPQREQFANDLEYYRALTRWEVKQEMKAEREAEEKEAVEAQAKKVQADYNKKAIEAQSQYDDWDEVVVKSDFKIPTMVGDAIVQTMTNGPDVAYFLGTHPEICEEMMAVHPLAAVAMAAKISEQLGAGKSEETEEGDEQESGEKAEAQPEKPKSRAPAPIKPVSSGSSRSSVPLGKTDFSTYKKLRQQGRVQ